MYEEAGIVEDNLTIYKKTEKILDYQIHGSPRKVFVWLAQLKNPDAKVILSNEHEAYKWVPVREACKMINGDDMKMAILTYDQLIQDEKVK